MSKQEIRIYALPTNKASKDCIGIHIDTKKVRIMEKSLDGNKVFEVGFSASSSQYQPHHLYTTIDESPKEGDWFIVEISEDNWKTSNFVLEKVKSINEVWVNNDLNETTRHIDNCKKVVATDDKDLKYNDLGSSILNHKRFGLNWENHVKSLPQISPEFQQAWVREANKSTPIVEAMIEMDIIYTLNERFTLDNLDEAEFVNQTEVENEHGTVFPASYLSKVELEFAPKSYQPKLNPQGYVTILPVKEKMHTQTEVENLILQFASDCENDEDLICYDGEIDGVKQYNAANGI